MKIKQLAFVLILLAIVGSAAVFFYRRSSETWAETATTTGKKVVSFAPNEVAHVTIKRAKDEINLVMKDGVWTVKERADYPANFDMISNLIRKIWELPAVQDVEAGPSQYGRLQLLPPDQGDKGGALLELKDAKDNRLAALIVGKKFMRESNSPMATGGVPMGRYVRPEGETARVVLVSDTLDDIDAPVTRWLDLTFVKLENLKTITLAGRTPQENWKVERNSAAENWKLADAKPGEEPDNSKITSLTSSVTGMSFTDVLAPNAAPADTGLDQPATLTVETFDNFTYVFRIGKVMGENYPVLVSVSAQLPKERTPGKDEKPDDKTKLDQEFQVKQKQLTDKLAAEKKLESRPYLISKTIVDQVLRDRTGLLAEKKTSPSPSPTPSAKPSPTPTPAKKTAHRPKKK